MPRCLEKLQMKQKKQRLFLLGPEKEGPSELGFQREVGCGHAESGENQSTGSAVGKEK